MITFDAYSDAYDAWFQRNAQVLESEVRLVAKALGEFPGEVLSAGCGTGLFESILRQQHRLDIRRGLEPAEPMAEIARKRGMEVAIAGAEAMPFPDASFDTVLFNGSPSYIADLDAAVAEASRILRPGGRAILIDVPAESSYGILYRLGGAYGSWDDPRLAGVPPEHPYPVELAGGANWRTTADKLACLERAGFRIDGSWQTLTRHPRYSNDAPEDPVPGYDRGDYVAVIGVR